MPTPQNGRTYSNNCRANHVTGFYMRGTLVAKVLTLEAKFGDDS